MPVPSAENRLPTTKRHASSLSCLRSHAQEFAELTSRNHRDHRENHCHVEPVPRRREAGAQDGRPDEMISRFGFSALDQGGAGFYDFRMTPLYEGKAKRLWATEDPNTLRMEFKNDATAFNGEKKAQFENKGRLNNEISTLIYGFLENAGVPTHFVRKIDDTNVEVKKVTILMVEVIVRNFSAGSYCKRTGIEEGRAFSQPIIEFSYKSDELGDPLINDDYIREMGLATAEDLSHLRKSALQVNSILIDFFAKCGLKLVDFKLEFGRLVSDPSIIVLADEISPDGCRLWDLKTGEKMDKDRFRRDLGNVMEAYEEVLGRLKGTLA